MHLRIFGWWWTGQVVIDMGCRQRLRIIIVGGFSQFLNEATSIVSDVLFGWLIAKRSQGASLECEL